MPKIYVAACLSDEDLLSSRLTASDGALDSESPAQGLQGVVAKVQARACFEVCRRWAQFGFSGQRLQDDIDAIVQADAVATGAVEQFGKVVSATSHLNITGPFRCALEAMQACLCACARVANPRVEDFTRVFFDLEVFATEAGGALPLVSHACRLDPDRLKVLIDPATFAAAIADARGPSGAGR